MYAWLWRALPGSRGARVLQLLAVLLAVLMVLWFWAFPWFSDTFSMNSL
jgi:hypothetical protein